MNSVFVKLHPRDIHYVRSAVRNCRLQLGASSPAAQRFASRAERFLRRESLPPFVFKSFLEDVRRWNRGKTLDVREDMVLLMRRAFALVGALRTKEGRT